MEKGINTGLASQETVDQINRTATTGRTKKAKNPINKPAEIWEYYECEMRIKNRLCGSVPLAKEMIKPWLESRKPTNKPEGARSIDDVAAEVAETTEENIEEQMERTTLGFQKDSKGMFIRAGNIKAHLKDAALQMAKVLDITALKAKVANRVYIKEYRVYLERDGQIIKKDDQDFNDFKVITGDISQVISETDGVYEQPVHVWTPQGQRNALKRINFLVRPTLRFTLMILKTDEECDIDIVQYLFKYGSRHGFGGERGLLEGFYNITLRKIDPPEDEETVKLIS